MSRAPNKFLNLQRRCCWALDQRTGWAMASDASVSCAFTPIVAAYRSHRELPTQKIQAARFQRHADIWGLQAPLLPSPPSNKPARANRPGVQSHTRTLAAASPIILAHRPGKSQMDPKPVRPGHSHGRWCTAAPRHGALSKPRAFKIRLAANRGNRTSKTPDTRPRGRASVRGLAALRALFFVDGSCA